MNSLLLSELRYLEAVSRLKGFSAAAEQVGITQSAMSQRIKRLEEKLGFPVLIRTTRQLRLTPQGDRLIQAYRSALAEIDGALDEINSEQAKGTLQVETFTTFGMYWLLPRLSDFHQRHPDIRIYLNTEEQIRTPGSGQADVIIRFSAESPAGFFSERLGTEEIFPVCSPILLDRMQLDNPADLLRQCTLLSTRNDGSDNCMKSWNQWSETTGIPVSNDIIYFSRTELVLQAALAGQGIALGRSLITADAIASGSLVPLPVSRFKAPFNYFFLTPYERANWTKIRLFHDWLKEQFSRP
ncbi:transcriptional regulator [Hahella sp. CCB-MM4]|uniref:LysR substrate-binding domain-containing protein n=1 Tax=Hahella sp. (strain CCB-MM4) TaxID=1926491 RepID=UPI000B9B7B87|nr:LysR substrate-binding domain-containing protein [Hahella sp. CCB-MM4]OZG72170.1 transcriptional regulator [Hahella sp. CCB-MM4]